MQYFPIFMDIKSQPVLVVGGGAVGERKIRLLLKAGAAVSVVSRELSEEVHQWVKRGSVDWLATGYEAAQLFGQRLVFAATDDQMLNRRVYVDAERLAIPVNVVDDRDFCRFISPAIVDRAPVQVAISTGGAAPVLARMLRAWIEKLLPSGLGQVAESASRLRDAVAARVAPENRRRVWEALLSESNVRQWSALSETQVDAHMNSQLHEQSAKMASGTQGKVYVVGAGPGRADLLTLRAHELLGQADVVLFDRLVSEDVLDRVRRDADRVYVGKRAGQHHRSQDEIHRLLVEHAKAGRTVVRLKGGDPFIFGRGGEEIEVLAKAGIDYEVVPGITAAAGCAAYGGIPLTHRDHAKVLSFVTGHLVSGEVDWAGIAGEGKTVAIYMGLKQAKVIRQALLDAGIRADMPVALISDGTRRSQQTFQGTVNGLSELAEQANPVAPALLIVGQVAEFASNLAWFQEIRQFSNAA